MLYLVPNPSSNTQIDEFFSSVQVIDGIQNAPEQNPKGFDLGYGEARDFALSLLGRLAPIPSGKEITELISKLIKFACDTPGGAEYIQVALAEV